ncbi:MAG: PD-(D/E)XK nuclease family protein [Prevotella sp.]|nr:PD-(D/E)XK nuclease family protein [Prevotella sp.]
MTEQEYKYSEILKAFSKIPIEENEPTFLDICHYPGERFEEICSRILEFYFQPKNKHGFRDLWFKALCELLKYECYDAFEMSSWTEEYTSESNDSNKRIDIVLQTPTLVVAIENKIGADLYNPLETYREHIDRKYKDLDKLLVVLTAHILSGEEVKKADQNGFTVIRYDQLFNKVKSMLGMYVAKGDQKYLAFMMDFIKTVENRVNMLKPSDMDKFFTKHREEVESLIEQYNGWKSRIFEQQKYAIADLLSKVQYKSNDTWWIYQGWDLGIDYLRDTELRIGIESEFKEAEGNPIGQFCIYITTWNLKCWYPYKEAVLERFPKDEEHILDEGEHNTLNRMYYHMPVIKRKNFNDDAAYFEEIVNRLDEYHKFIKELTTQIGSQRNG